MNHIICGVCTSDLSQPFSCLLKSSSGHFITHKLKGHLNNDFFSSDLIFRFDDKLNGVKQKDDVDSLKFLFPKFCLGCNRVIYEGVLYYCFRIPLYEIPLVFSTAHGYRFKILKYRLEHGIESVIPLSSGRLSLEEDVIVKTLLRSIIGNDIKFLKSIAEMNLNRD